MSSILTFKWGFLLYPFAWHQVIELDLVFFKNLHKLYKFVLTLRVGDIKYERGTDTRTQTASC